MPSMFIVEEATNIITNKVSVTQATIDALQFETLPGFKLLPDDGIHDIGDDVTVAKEFQPQYAE